MTTLFKDYNKGTTDLLTKNFSSCGEWKVESKGKAPRGAYALTTTSNTHGSVNVDIEGLTDSGAYYGKLTFASRDLTDVKVTVRAEDFDNHRVEAIIGHKGPALCDISVEVNHQTMRPIAGGRLSINDKFTQKAVELALSMATVDGVQVGCGTKYDLKSQTIDWTAACRLEAKNGLVLTAQTNRLLDLTASMVSKAPLHPKFQPCVAATMTTNPQSMTWDGSMAVEWGCQVILGNTAKVRVNKNLDWIASYIANLRGGWTLVLSIDKTMKAGLTLTRN
ncbi:putative voltage-dependent anion-selective channel [Leishmania infantum JPCM5]|uniref:Voltage-dependent_anion-selective_channel_-_putative n=2 Tax=Leishmania infantum TaxID=5671 RepID=A0A6L0WRC5_LEIIN|nr:putative voltage-dependent anion-selective channel [Leishmania infantum JPCM5]CAC9437956.1 voltage-dependent_anion-selective_channel_-_putative [Leishmania infantum]CAM65273.1 putative voltage-dependent anion-selective channel [Leishmania infantum JPCM5]SUZ38667.1 voltage-dependent_anion-selective_channel_-_putative [Leishmania infantum]|eukprot:XP_001462733.1 putative voltage-dependent anion-selective channel [Leishmania infantum JPCM5]